jgi:glycosyltransferase involved in cell wall biosynthesis
MMEDLPFFSVIIPTYERPGLLAECIRALARLDYPAERFEVIVVDDGSAVAPAAELEEFGELLDVRLLTQANAGPAAARNRGAAAARGHFLAFTDDDCAPDAGWLRALAARFAETPDRLVGGRTLNALPANPHAETSQLIIEVVYEHYNTGPAGPRFFASNNLAAPAELFRAGRGFDEAFTTSEDREVCDRWLARGLRLAYAPDAVVLHAHALTLRTLWRQHFGYGRGARHFHRARAARGAGGFRPEGSFYLKLLRASLSRARRASSLAPPLLLFWAQLANAVGFIYEHARPRVAAPRGGATDVVE